MVDIRVWAPHVRSVELEIGNQRLPMTKGDAGWWSIDTPLVQHGTDYAFLVDGNGPFPDPRSPSQPAGIEGSSRWVDHTRFNWTDNGFQPPPLESAVIYELHTGTFTPEGTFQSAIERLDYLVDLGVTHVELMPVAEFSGSRGWGYDGVDLYAPHHSYGGPEGLKQLVNACHQRGLAVLLDVVYNHLGPAGNYLSQFGPYFTNRYKTPWGEAINLDGADSDEVRRFLVDNALMWLRDYHIDGLRIDAIHAILDISAIHILEQLAVEVRKLETALGRRLVLIAESDLNDPRVIRGFEVGGYGHDAQWNEDFHHALQAVLTGERKGYYADFGRLSDLGKTLTEGQCYDGRYSVYRRRRHGRPAMGIPGTRFVGCLQNHDQVGNRAKGERTSQLINQGLLKIGAALVFTAPFVPMLFQGEEWAASTPFLYFTDHQDPKLGEAVRRGRRREFAAFGWNPKEIPDPQDADTFQRSKLNWEELAQTPYSEILDWHRALINLRRNTPDLKDGRMDATAVDFDETERWLVLTRGSVVVACNFADISQDIPSSKLNGQKIVLASEDGIAVKGNVISMPRHSVAILTG